jgi:hypothetical protein
MKKISLLSILLFLVSFTYSSLAQKLPSISEKTKGLKKYEGFFPFFWDEDAGKIWLQIDKFDKEFLYYSSLPAGLGSNDIGLDRGLLGDEKVVFFQKIGRKSYLLSPIINTVL